MKYSLTTLALATLALAKPMPQGVTDTLLPDTPAPEGCVATVDGTWNIQTVNVSSAPAKVKRQLDGLLTLTLTDGVLKDQAGRTGYIAANRQFQFDNPIQTGAVITAGFSVCENYTLALGGSAIWWQCLSGDFYNLYDESQGGQCNEIYIEAINLSSGGGAPAPTSAAAAQSPDGQPTAAPAVTQLTDGQPQAVTQISDGQVQAVTQIADGQIQAPGVTQIADGQPQAPAPTAPVTQLPDGQPQAPSAAVTQIGDGQVQAPSAAVTQIGDGQVQAPSAAVTQIGDGQVQAPSAAVTQIGDGQVQAPSAAVTQIGDGQIQAPTSTGAAVTQISDGQIQATSAVSQIGDGQIQAPTGTAAVSQIPDGQVQASSAAPAAYTGAAAINGANPAQYLLAGLVGAAVLL